MKATEKYPRPLFPLLAILDADAAARAGWELTDLAAAYLAGGARLLQIRAKSAPSGWFLEIADAVVAAARSHGATVIVNDRADIARLADADGVHVGQDDLTPVAVRRSVGAERMIGLSTHTLQHIDEAVREPVDYVAVGPVFGTRSKATGYDAVGLALVTEAAARARARGLKIVAIGGITLDRAAEVMRAGADSVAVIGDLLASGDPRARVREYLDRLSVM